MDEIVSGARESISARLRQMIAVRGQQRTAELCGISRQQIDRWLQRGNRINPTLEHLIAMSVGMDTPVQHLLGLEARGTAAPPVDAERLSEQLLDSARKMQEAATMLERAGGVTRG